METDKDGEVGKGDAQQTDKLQEDELRKLQAVKKLRRILTGVSLLEGEGSSQGSESEREQEEGAQMMEGKAGRQVKVVHKGGGGVHRLRPHNGLKHPAPRSRFRGGRG